MSGVVLAAGIAFLAIVGGLAAGLRRLRGQVELEEAERALAEDLADTRWTAVARSRRDEAR